MKDNKKKLLCEEELELVTGGAYGDLYRPYNCVHEKNGNVSYKCIYCDEQFGNNVLCLNHQFTCSKNPKNMGS